jgi:hypothetical protein
MKKKKKRKKKKKKKKKKGFEQRILQMWMLSHKSKKLQPM